MAVEPSELFNDPPSSEEISLLTLSFTILAFSSSPHAAVKRTKIKTENKLKMRLIKISQIFYLIFTLKLFKKSDTLAKKCLINKTKTKYYTQFFVKIHLFFGNTSPPFSREFLLFQGMLATTIDFTRQSREILHKTVSIFQNIFKYEAILQRR